MAKLPGDILKTYKAIAELMATDENLSFRQAAAQLGFSYTIDEAELHSRRKSFKRLLWDEKHKYAKELGENPNRSREGTIGRLELCAQKLIDEGNWKQAAEVLKILAQAEGWLIPEAQVNVFGNLSHNEIVELREKVRAIKEKPSQEDELPN